MRLHSGSVANNASLISI
ncbi:hypothetical protein [Candidatus Pantoea deserta]